MKTKVLAFTMFAVITVAATATINTKGGIVNGKQKRVSTMEMTTINSTSESNERLTASAPDPQGDRYRKFVKTHNKCKYCSKCTGYWGWQHGNGTFEGPCQNNDGWGHPCGHDARSHGLRNW